MRADTGRARTGSEDSVAPGRATATDRGTDPERSGATLAGWGNLPAAGEERRSEDLAAVASEAPLTRGLGRSYGDASLPPADRPVAAGSRRADRILDFDPATGRLRAESGLTLRTLNEIFLDRGWFTPVSPGTQDVTLGGMVAADIHGKNHHRAGTFGRHVENLLLLTAAGEEVSCSRAEEPELFLSALGGMGLTGHILEVELRLERIPSPWIRRESVRTKNLEESLETLAALGERWPYTVAWLDCLVGGRGHGRGIVEGGGWAEPGDDVPGVPPSMKRRFKVPFPAPSWLLNRLSIGAYNRWRWRRHGARPRRGVVHPEVFFYPLDAIEDWYLLYGRRGFTQYQCVLPREAGLGAVNDLLGQLRERGGRPFLVVLKDFGMEEDGILSFPRPGHTLGIDLPVDDGIRDVVDALNEVVLGFGGRIYLAKDAFTRPEHFVAMEGHRLRRFLAVKKRWDPEGRIRSRQWDRLVGSAGGRSDRAAEGVG